MKKIIATDLDGTLFYPKDTKEMISKPNLFFLQNFIDNGGKTILISGRSHLYCQKTVKKIGRPCATISYNGACIFDGEKMIYQNTIKNDEAANIIDEIFKTFHNHGVFLMTEKGLSIHLVYKSKIIRWGFGVYYKTQGIYAENLLPKESDYEEELKNGHIFKIMIYFGLGKRMQNKAKQANSILRNTYDNVECNWSKNVIEITAKDCSKAKALQTLLESKNDLDKEIYVVGDSGNDISLFKAFPYASSHFSTLSNTLSNIGVSEKPEEIDTTNERALISASVDSVTQIAVRLNNIYQMESAMMEYATIKEGGKSGQRVKEE